MKKFAVPLEKKTLLKGSKYEATKERQTVMTYECDIKSTRVQEFVGMRKESLFEQLSRLMCRRREIVNLKTFANSPVL